MTCLVLIDRSDDTKTSDIAFLAKALSKESVSLCIAWDLPYVWIYHASEPVNKPGHWEMVFEDDSDDLKHFSAWHGVDSAGDPYSRTMSRRGAVDLAGSHEAFETLGNPYVSQWAPMPFMQGVECAKEVCDPVQGDWFTVSVTIFGETRKVRLQNYVLPAWFDEAAPGPYDRMGLCKRPGEIRPGGYMPLRKDGKAYSAWGKKIPAWQFRKRAIVRGLMERKLHGGRFAGVLENA